MHSQKEMEIDYEAFYRKAKKKSRITAIVLASATVISLIFLVFAFAQKAVADKATVKAYQLEQEAIKLRSATEEQQRQAREHLMLKDKQISELTEQLQRCSNKKR
jgi:hypothetical protein